MRRRRSHCRQCRRPDDEVGRISKTGLCARCGVENMASVNLQLAAKDGPAYRLWLKRQAAGQEAYMRKQLAATDQRARRQG